MEKLTIVWDFDGTLLPNDPYDSEQTLMMYRLYEAGEKIPFPIRVLARALLYADQRQHLRKVFKKFYIRLMTGSPVDLLDPVCRRLAARIPQTDRRALMQLADSGHTMMVLSCGTADLIQRTLEHAGLTGCFTSIAGNQFEDGDGSIRGMTLHVPNPEDKVRYLVRQQIDPGRCAAVGDGYTDIPMLDWAQISVLVDRTGKKQIKYARKNYRFVRSLTEILDIIKLS
jgi:phosphoserine phosphatase